MLPKDSCEIFIKNLPFWDKLLPNEKELLCRGSSHITQTKGTTIHRGSENCLGVVLIQSGVLRVYMLSEEGREITLYRLYRGDFCVLSASCVLEAITFDVLIDIEETADIIVINSPAFYKLKNDNIYVEAFAYKLSTARFSDAMWAMQQILFMRADQRFASFLLSEIEKSGNMQINMTHDQIAKHMGSAREVVSRMVKYFVNEGILESNRGCIKVLSKTSLQSLI